MPSNRCVGSMLSSNLRKALVSFAIATMAAAAVAAMSLPNLFPFHDPSGLIETNSSAGKFDESGPFFQSLGTNGRSCATCHIVGNGMGLSAAHTASIFRQTNGHDPLFSRLTAPSALRRCLAIRLTSACCEISA